MNRLMHKPEIDGSMMMCGRTNIAAHCIVHNLDNVTCFQCYTHGVMASHVYYKSFQHELTLIDFFMQRVARMPPDMQERSIPYFLSYTKGFNGADHGTNN